VLRVEAARAMIEASNQPIEVVARETGFADPERMRRAFLRAFGQPPQAIKRAAREQAMLSAYSALDAVRGDTESPRPHARTAVWRNRPGRRSSAPLSTPCDTPAPTSADGASHSRSSCFGVDIEFAMVVDLARRPDAGWPCPGAPAGGHGRARRVPRWRRFARRRPRAAMESGAIAATGTWMSMRSSRGPEILSW
jgi:hypothetical protein